ncbi:MAG: NAD(P)H-binding protein [Bacteroidia bacterium]|nr:NAD(P)H-binding protein [Bacteroidia bacterium]
MKTALVLGGTGLVGGHLVRILLRDERYSLVKMLVRKSVDLHHEKLAQVEVDFDHLQSEDLQADDVFCCLGTTIAKAETQAAFRKVDFDYPVRVGELALEMGARQYFMVSSIGADAQSSVFYAKVKGETEAKLASLGYSTFVAFRPSFLLGNRQEFRFGEKIGIGIAKLFEPLMVGGLRKYKGIEAHQVAGAMVKWARLEKPGNFIVENPEIED